MVGANEFLRGSEISLVARKYLVEIKARIGLAKAIVSRLVSYSYPAVKNSVFHCIAEIASRKRKASDRSIDARTVVVAPVQDFQRCRAAISYI